MAAADTADLRVRLAELQARLDGAPHATRTGRHRRPGTTAPPDPPPRRPPRSLLLAGLVIGVALLVDGILTIVWQEPITALQQSRDQAALRTDLQELQRDAAPPRRRSPGRAPRLRIRRQALTLLRAKRPDGSALGSVDHPADRAEDRLRGVHRPPTPSRRAPATTAARSLPGLYGTVGLAGHRTTYGAPFRRVDELSPRLAHHPADALRPVHLQGDRHAHHHAGRRLVAASRAPARRRLVLTACHPLYSAAKRIVVSARLVSATPA